MFLESFFTLMVMVMFLESHSSFPALQLGWRWRLKVEERERGRDITDLKNKKIKFRGQ